MEKENLQFPVTTEAFIAYQEAGIHRKLERMEREAIEVWVPIVNRAYAEGTQGDSCALVVDIEHIDGYIAEYGNDIPIVRFLKSFRWWISHAWAQGRADAGKAVGV